MNLPAIIDGANTIPALIGKLQEEIQWVDDMTYDHGNYVIDDGDWRSYAISKALLRFCKSEAFKANHREELVIERHLGQMFNKYTANDQRLPKGVRKAFRRMWE